MVKTDKLKEEIEIPSGVTIEVRNHEIIIKKGPEEITRKIHPKIMAKIDNGKAIIESDRSTKKEKKVFGSLIAHIKNALNGLEEKWKYKLQGASVHFPMTLTHDKATNELVIKNFLGERKDRRINLPKGVEVKINKDQIEILSSDIEKAGQAAASIEKGTKIRYRDRRVFQDGIFITEKPGREI